MMESAFQFDHDQASGQLRCKIQTPRFDAAVTPEFKKAFEAAWRAETDRIVLDFSGVDFIDSSGVGALLALQKKYSESDHPLTLVNAGKNVVEVMELLRLHRLFNLNPESA
jgi:anti-sigma B factor antagonist